MSEGLRDGWLEQIRQCSVCHRAYRVQPTPEWQAMVDRLGRMGLEPEVVQGLGQNALDAALRAYRSVHGHISHGVCPTCLPEHQRRMDARFSPEAP